MQRSNPDQNHSRFFTRTGPYAATGAKTGALFGGGIGLTAALCLALMASEDNKLKRESSGLYLVAIGAIGGTTAGAVIGGAGGATVGFSADLVSAGISLTFNR